MFNNNLEHRYSIRKLSIGAASVLIGLVFVGGLNNKIIKADTVKPAQAQAPSQNQSDKQTVNVTVKHQDENGQTIAKDTHHTVEIIGYQDSHEASTPSQKPDNPIVKPGNTGQTSNPVKPVQPAKPVQNPGQSTKPNQDQGQATKSNQNPGQATKPVITPSAQTNQKTNPAKPVQPTKPNTNSGQVTNNKPDNLPQVITKQTVSASQITSFVDSTGKTLRDDNIQSGQFTFDGKNWNHDTITFKNVPAPIIKGYVALTPSVSGSIVTRDNPNTAKTIIYKQVGNIIAVDNNNNPIKDLAPVPYANSENDPTKIADVQTAPIIKGYKPEQTTFSPVSDDEDTRIVYDIDPNYVPDQARKTFTYTINYVDSNGNQIDNPYVATHDFTMADGQSIDPENTEYTFVSPNNTIILGYVTTQARPNNFTVKATDTDLNHTVNVVYSKIGYLIPEDMSGKQLATAEQYNNNPFDASLVMDNLIPPAIDGYVPEVQAVTPKDPTKDTIVRYVKAKAGKITINFVDTDTGATLQSKVLTGEIGSSSNYNPEDDIIYWQKQGFEADNNFYPANVIFTKNPLEYNIQFSHTSSNVQYIPGEDSTDYQAIADGTPIDADIPWGAQPDLKSYHQVHHMTVRYKGAGSATPKANVQTTQWTRRFTMDNVTGQISSENDWQTDPIDYNGVPTPVVQTYHADKADIPGEEATRKNKTYTVTYKRNGRIVEDFYDQNGKAIKLGVKGPYYITNPTDPTAVLGNLKVPSFNGYVQTVRHVDPKDPDSDIHVSYIKVPDVVVIEVDHYYKADSNYDGPSALEQAYAMGYTNPVVVNSENEAKIVQNNWNNILKQASYYNNRQDGKTDIYYGKTTKANTSDTTHTTKNLLHRGDESLASMLDSQVDAHSANDDTDLLGQDGDKKNGKVLNLSDLSAINSGSKSYAYPSYTNDTDYVDLDKDIYDQVGLDSKNFGNDNQALPKGVTPVHIDLLKPKPKSVSINPSLDADDDNVYTGVRVHSYSSDNNNNFNASKLALKSTLPSAALFNSFIAMPNADNITKYKIVIDGKVVASGLTKQEASNYAKYLAKDENVAGYTQTGVKQNGNQLIISYTKDKADESDTKHNSGNIAPAKPDQDQAGKNQADKDQAGKDQDGKDQVGQAGKDQKDKPIDTTKPATGNNTKPNDSADKPVKPGTKKPNSNKDQDAKHQSNTDNPLDGNKPVPKSDKDALQSETDNPLTGNNAQSNLSSDNQMKTNPSAVNTNNQTDTKKDYKQTDNSGKQASSMDNINKRHLNNNTGLVNTGARHVIDNYKPVNASVRPKLVPVDPQTPALPQTANTVNTGNSSAVNTTSQNSASVLPQTGSKKELGLVALGLIAISLSVFGLKDPDKEKS